MKNREIILSGLGGLIIALLAMFNSEANKWLIEHWGILVFFLGLFLIALSVISWWVRFIVRIELKEHLNFILINHLNPLTNDIRDLQGMMKTVVELSTGTAILTGITNRISRDFIYDHFNRESLISALLDESYTLNDIQNYKFKQDFIDEFRIKAHEQEIEKIKKSKDQ